MFEIREPSSKQDMDDMYELRKRVMAAPNAGKTAERDEMDGTYKVLSVIAVSKEAEAERVVGTARLHRNNDEEGQIKFMCIDEGFRNLGLSSKMLEYLHARAKKMGLSRVVANVVESEKKFYLTQGYEVKEKLRSRSGDVVSIKMGKPLAGVR